MSDKGESAYAKLPKRVAEEAERGARELRDEVSRGIARASSALAAPKGTEVEGLLGATNLPELGAAEPIETLAVRLDREGDLWRDLALRELSRLAWADRIAQGVALFVVAGTAGLGVVAGLVALVGGERAGTRGLLLLAGALGLVAAGIVTHVVVASIRRTQRDIARDALERADLAELRLHRVGVLLAWKNAGGSVYQDALARMERDASSGR